MFALAPIILSVLAVSTAWTDSGVETVTLLTTPWEGPVETEDAAIISPEILGVRFYLNDEGEVTDLQFEFSLVPDITYYRIWREVEITRGIDENGNVVTLEEPASEFVPWASVKADEIANAEQGTVIVSPLGLVLTELTDWAISATVERDGALYRSPLSYFDLPSSLPTAVESKSWGQVKHRTIAP